MSKKNVISNSPSNKDGCQCQQCLEQNYSFTTSSSSTSSFGPRLVSASMGAIITSLAVTPLDVVKVRQQASIGPSSTTQNSLGLNSNNNNLPKNVRPCPRGCGTFVLNNGLMDCVLPKSAVPYFDKFGRVMKETPPSSTNNHTSHNIRNSTVTTTTTTTMTSPKLQKPLGTFSMLRRIFLREGFGGIYAGLSPTLVMSVPNTVLYFTAYDEIVSILRSPQNKCSNISDFWIPLVGGSFARCLASFATAPLELIRTRQASYVGSGQSPPGLAQEFRTLVNKDGLLSLYKGLAPTLYRDVPFSAIYWLFLERFKAGLYRIDKCEKSSLRLAGHAFISGAAAGMIAAAFTTPFDVVKTRQQMVMAASPNEAIVIQNHQARAVRGHQFRGGSFVCHHDGAVAYKPPLLASSSPPTPTNSRNATRNTLSLMKTIVETEGITGLWRGNQTRMIKVAPACAIMISCYELGKQVMQ